MTRPVETTCPPSRRRSRDDGTSAVVVAEDRTTLDRAFGRYQRLLTTDPALHIVLSLPPPGAGVLVIPEVAWLKRSEALQRLHDHYAHRLTIASAHVTDRASVIPVVSAMTTQVDATVIIVGRPPAWATHSRTWWSQRSAELQQHTLCRRALSFRDAHVLLVAEGKP